MTDVERGAADAEADAGSGPPTPGPSPSPTSVGVGVGVGVSAGAGVGGAAGEVGARVCEVALEEFEGPLDLLLHLVRRHELDILDIPISFVCEKYLEYIDFMQALDLEVAGDYLVMAATLAYLKSRELVPQGEHVVEDGGEDGEGGPDPREQLILRLLEYQKFKDAADRLDARPIAGRDTFPRGGVVELPPVDAGLAPITLFRLADAYQRVLERARIHKSHEVVMETISVAARMEQLTAVLIERDRFEFEGLFLERSWQSESELRSMLVVTLMSVLELVRMGVASVHQPFGSETIVVERVASADDAREALRGYDESLSFGDGKRREPSGEASEQGVAFDDVAVDEGEAIEDDLALDGDADAVEDDVALEDGEMIEDGETLEDGETVEDDALDDGEVIDDGLTVEDDAIEDGLAFEDGEAAEDEPDPGARVTEPATAGGEPFRAAAPSAREDDPEPPDAGAWARSVVSESPAPEPTVEGIGVNAPLPTGEDGASEPTEGDGQEHGENGEAEAVEGS